MICDVLISGVTGVSSKFDISNGIIPRIGESIKYNDIENQSHWKTVKDIHYDYLYHEDNTDVKSLYRITIFVE
jgi:hypothetical protein